MSNKHPQEGARRALPGRPRTLTVVFAHPDDEVLFFLGCIRSLRPEKLQLICATGDFGAETTRRRAEFTAAAQALGGEEINLGLEDRRAPGGDPVGAPLDRKQLAAALAAIVHEPGDPVVSHGPMGEYGHRHHVDVFKAAWRRFGGDLWCAAGSLEVHECFRLGRQGAVLKNELMDTLYPSQEEMGAWACGDESLCHVASSRFAPLFGASAADRGVAQSFKELAEAFIASLERRYLAADRRLPPVTRTIDESWRSPKLTRYLAARVADWRQELTVSS